MLQIDTDNTLKLEANDLVGQRIAILGISGSGKTNTAAVFIEEQLDNGIPLTIVDIEGEYWGLKQRYDILVVGKSPHIDLAVSPDQAATIADIAARQQLTVVLDLSGFKIDESFTFLEAYLNKLWEILSTQRQPYGLVVEEASEFIPQGTGTPLKNILKTFASRGRKRGLSLMVINQRATTLDKNVLTQAGLRILHHVNYPNDLKVYKDIIPLPDRQVEDIVLQLQPGQAVVVWNNKAQVVNIRVRTTFHAGSTPELDDTAAPTLRKLDNRLLEQIANALQQGPAPADECTELRQEVQRLRAELGRRDRAPKPAQIPAAPAPAAKPPAKPDAKPNVKPLPSWQQPVANGKPSAADERVSKRAARQWTAFNKFITNLQNVRKDQLLTFAYLAEHDGKSVSLLTIAAELGYAPGTLIRNPPWPLIKANLIERAESEDGVWYKTKLAQQLKERFPDLPANDMLRRIIALGD